MTINIVTWSNLSWWLTEGLSTLLYDIYNYIDFTKRIHVFNNYTNCYLIDLTVKQVVLQIFLIFAHDFFISHLFLRSPWSKQIYTVLYLSQKRKVSILLIPGSLLWFPAKNNCRPVIVSNNITEWGFHRIWRILIENQIQ